MNALHLFTLAGIPVRATLGFLLLLVWFGYGSSAHGAAGIAGTLLALTLSVLIHEFGHALVARRYRLAPNIVLHGWGGLCFHERALKDKHDVLIILGGPLLQIAVGAIAWAIMGQMRPGGVFFWYFRENFIWISVYWGALNLVPIFPLDGGQLFRMAMLRLVKPPAKAERITHIVGIVLAIVAAIAGYVFWKSPLVALLAVMWVLENARYLQQGSPVPVRVRSQLADRLLAEATQAAAQGDWHEARRLAFQARDEKTVTDDQLTRILEMITLASAELRDWSEVLEWSKHAPKNAEIFTARLRALCGLGRRDDARRELEAGDAPRLEVPLRERIEAWIAGRATP